MEDTLRYYFSSIFQGFAALITLGAMYYLHFLDKMESRKRNIHDCLQVFYNIIGNTNKIPCEAIEFVRSNYIPMPSNLLQYSYVPSLIEKYDSYTTIENKIQMYLPRILKKAILLLILSLMSLFAIGYSLFLNYVLFIMGIILFFISVNTLFLIKNLIIEVSQNKD